MEHLHEFGLVRDPFANDPVSGFYYESPVHRAAQQRLMRGVTQGKGLCLLVGEAGCGKSTLARRVLDELEEEAYEAGLLVILHSGVDASWLLARMARLLGVEEPAEEPQAIFAQVYDRLSVFAEEGRRPVVIVDDAHLLAARELMEALRALLDLEYEDRHPLTLILVGAPELDRTLALDPALPHRLDVRVSLDPMDLPTSAAYLGHRISAAGGHPSLLEAGSVEAIQRLGCGLPRRMNTLADNALFEAHLASRTRVTPGDVERAARDLGLAAVDVAPLAEHLHAGDAARAPGGEPIDLTHEIAGGDAGRWADDFAGGAAQEDAAAVLPAFEDEIKEAEEAPLFEGDAPATVLMDEGDADDMDRDVEDLFDNLIES